MGYIATWGPKGFIVSPQKIVPFDGLSTSVTLKEDSENDTSGTAPTNTKGLELQAVSLSTTYFRGAGVDPRAQWDEWCSLVGEAYPLYIGEERFGPQKLKLKSVNLSEVKTDNQGRFLFVKVGLSFEEYVDNQKSKTTITTSKTTSTPTASTGNTSSQKAAAIYASTVDKKTAFATGASTSDKAAKK